MENKFISLVVYLHNDESYISGFLDKITGVMGELFSKYEIIFADDSCTDDTVKIIRQYDFPENDDSIVSIIHMGFYQGLEASMNAGRDIAIGDFVYEFDQINIDYDISLVGDVYRKMLEGYDVVSARNDRYERFTSRLFYGLFNRFSRSANDIGSETFRIISRRTINRVKSMGIHIPYRKAIYSNCGLNTAVITYDGKNAVGPDKKKQKKRFRERSMLALDSFIYFTNIMERVSFAISGLFLLITLGALIYAVIDHFVGNDISSGWPSLVCLISLGFFGVFTLLTIVMKYLSVLLDLVFRQQRYMVSGIEKLSNSL